MSDFYNKYPYTDFHELNLDWVIERVKKLTEDWAATLEEWNNTEEQWQELYNYVHDYFDNLDVQVEINNKINAMIADGTFVTITTPVIESKVASMMPSTVASQIGATVASQIGATVASQISDTVAGQIDAAVVAPVDSWLTAHITQPTTPVVDTSLSIPGAAADAAVVGADIAEIHYVIDGSEINAMNPDIDLGSVASPVNADNKIYANNILPAGTYYGLRIMASGTGTANVYKYDRSTYSTTLVATIPISSGINNYYFSPVTITSSEGLAVSTIRQYFKGNYTDPDGRSMKAVNVTDGIIFNALILHEFISSTVKDIRNDTTSLQISFDDLTLKGLPDYTMSGTGSTSDNSNIYGNEGLLPGEYVGVAVYTGGLTPNQSISVYEFSKIDYTTTLIETFTGYQTGLNEFTFTTPVTIDNDHSLAVKCEQKYISNYVNPDGLTVRAYNVTTGTKLNALMQHKFIRTASNINDIESELPGLKLRTFSVIGDSISSYSGTVPSGYATWYPTSNVTNQALMWWSVLERETGLQLLKNASWSGSGLRGSRTGSAQIGCSQARCNDLGVWTGGVLTESPDIIIVYFGINEFGHLIGDYDAKTAMPTQDNLQTFSEAYAVMLDNMKTTYPDAFIFCSTLYPRYKNENDPSDPFDFPNIDSYGHTIEDFNEVIRTLARAFSCNVIEMSDANINRNNATTYLMDYLHPNKAGQQRMGETISKYVKNFLYSLS